MWRSSCPNCGEQHHLRAPMGGGLALCLRCGREFSPATSPRDEEDPETDFPTVPYEHPEALLRSQPSASRSPGRTSTRTTSGSGSIERAAQARRILEEQQIQVTTEPGRSRGSLVLVFVLLGVAAAACGLTGAVLAIATLTPAPPPAAAPAPPPAPPPASSPPPPAPAAAEPPPVPRPAPRRVERAPPPPRPTAPAPRQAPGADDLLDPWDGS